MASVKGYPFLPADEGKAASQFEQKILEMRDKTFLQIIFVERRRGIQVKKFKYIRVADYLPWIEILGIFYFQLSLDAFLVATGEQTLIEEGIYKLVAVVGSFRAALRFYNQSADIPIGIDHRRIDSNGGGVARLDYLRADFIEYVLFKRQCYYCFQKRQSISDSISVCLLVLMFGVEGGVYFTAAVGHEGLGVKAPLIGEIGLVDRDMYSGRRHVVGVSGHGLESAFDGYGNNRETELSRKQEGAALEWAHLAVVGACSLRENHERHIAAEGFLRVGDCLLDAVDIAVVHKDVADSLAGLTYKEYLLQRLLHEPFEGVVQIAVDGPDIERALMIGHKHVGLTAVDILASGHFHPHEPEQTDTAGPEPGRVVARPALTAEGCGSKAGQ